MSSLTHSTAYRYRLFAFSFLCVVSGGLASTLIPSYLPALIRDFTTGDEESTGAIVNASFIYGMLAGGLLLGYLSDRYGRKTALQAAVFSIGLCMLLAAFQQAWEWLVISRLMTGFGVGGVLLVSAVMISEEWITEKKSIALGILSVGFPLGIFSAGLITYNIPEWRHAMLTGILPLALALVSPFLLKETTEWLENKSGPAKETRLLEEEGVVRNIITGSLIYGTMLIGLWAVFAWLPTWVQGIVADSDGQQERGISMMIFAAGGLAGGFSSGWLSNRFGMRNIMLLCFGGTFVLSVALFRFTNALNMFTYMNMSLIAVFFGTSQGVLNNYIPRLFPTAYRSRATGICFNISRLFTATVVFFVGWLVDSLGGYGNALFSFSFVFLAGLVVTFFHE